MNFCQTRVRLVQLGTVFTAAALIAGCGNNYRPTVVPIVSSGPAPQPTSNTVVVSAPSTTTPGVATIIDYSGDSIMGEAEIGIGPTTFALSADGSYGFTINSDGTLTEFPILTTLQNNAVLYTTLPSTAQPLNLFAPTNGLWAADLCAANPITHLCEGAVDRFTGGPETLQNSIPLKPTPVMMTGSGNSGVRYYAISQNIANATGVECNASPTTQNNGWATGIESTSLSSDPPIPVGKCPVYAVQSTDSRRLFVLNRGSDTISVINTQNDTLDTCTGLVNQNGQPVTCHPTLPLSLNAVTATGITPPNGTAGMTPTAGPVYAEYNYVTNQLIVANYDGGTISVIDVSLDEYGNDYNTYDSSGNITGGFGTTYTIPVGHNPASVTVLYDGSRAYTANQSDKTVSIVNLSSHTLSKTLPVTGSPRTVVSTQNSTMGKVYVASPDSNVLTIIRTDQDIVATTLLLEGNAVDVRVTSPTTANGNSNYVSRAPGYGQPCNKPGLAPTASIAACKAQQ